MYFTFPLGFQISVIFRIIFNHLFYIKHIVVFHTTLDNKTLNRNTNIQGGVVVDVQYKRQCGV